jgi:hypothetical protein
MKLTEYINCFKEYKTRLFLCFKNIFENNYKKLLFYFKLIFYVFKSFWCADIKNKLKKNSILIYFQAKITLKNNHYHNNKQAFRKHY